MNVLNELNEFNILITMYSRSVEILFLEFDSNQISKLEFKKSNSLSSIDDSTLEGLRTTIVYSRIKKPIVYRYSWVLREGVHC